MVLLFCIYCNSVAVKLFSALMLVIVCLCIVSLVVLVSFVCLCAYDVVVFCGLCFVIVGYASALFTCLNVVIAFGYGFN